MEYGLSEKELTKLSSFGGTPSERLKNVYGINDKDINCDEPDLATIIDNLGGALQRKMVELIVANNKKISEQLKKV